MSLPAWLERLPNNPRYMPTTARDCGETAVMVHGLIRRGGNMSWLGRRLNRVGYDVYLYDYATTTKGIAEHGKEFKYFLEQVVQANPNRRLNLVTHSMGGIITREALGHLADGGGHPDEILSSATLGRIIMLAPPNFGSDTARLVTRWLPFSRHLIKPLAELSSAPDAYIHQVPIPRGLDIAVIAGRFDGKVSLPYTHLPGMRAHTVVNSEHSFIMYLPWVADLVIRYLQTGHF